MSPEDSLDLAWLPKKHFSVNLMQRGAALAVFTEGVCDSGWRKGLLCGGLSVPTFILPACPWHSSAAKAFLGEKWSVYVV